MGIGKPSGFLCVVFSLSVLFAGCSSSGGGSDPVSSGDQTYSSPGSDLVLEIPETLNVSQKEIEYIFNRADQVAHCYTTNRDAIDIVLAEACFYYDMFYLFPQYFPLNLNNILDVNAYTEYLKTYDPFTYYFPPESYIALMSFLDGDRAFIGFTIGHDNQTVTNETPLLIEEIDPFSRAWIDGFQVGDKIIEIDGISLEGMGLDSAILLFPTNEEEAVEIIVERNGVEITIDTAAEENIGFLLYGEIAYLNARSFTETTGEEIRLDYNKLKVEAGGSVAKIILDLRGNAGGALSGALMLVDYLVDNDIGFHPILSNSGPAYEEKTEYLGAHNNFNIGDFDKTNFVLLVDEHSASASEIVAAALKYYGTATLIGKTTFGKGIGQGIVELIDGSGVMIPWCNTLPPSGESYHGIGVSPDYHLTAPASSFDEDPVLDAAVEYLNTGSITVTASSRILGEKSTRLSKKANDPFKGKLLKMDRSGHSF